MTSTATSVYANAGHAGLLQVIDLQSKPLRGKASRHFAGHAGHFRKLSLKKEKE